MAFGSVCPCDADEASVVGQSIRLEAKLGSRRVHHMCEQLTDLLGLLAAMQALPESSGHYCFVASHCAYSAVLLYVTLCQLAHHILPGTKCS